MQAYNKYKTIVFTITTILLFVFWSYISQISITNKFMGIIFAGIVSLGTYQFIAKTMELLLFKISFIKKIVFGNTFLEGCWVGCYRGLDGNPNYYIECLEQTFDCLIVRGKCFANDDSFKGNWTSENVIINEREGTITYTYETDMINSTHKNQGLAVFNFERGRGSDAPKKMYGFSSDIFASKKLPSIEIKAEGLKTLIEKELIEKAHQLYNENRDYFN